MVMLNMIFQVFACAPPQERLQHSEAFPMFRISICVVKDFIQPASRSPPGQVWRQFFYHVGSLFESIVTPWGHFGRPWDVAFRSKNWLWRPRCTMTPQHRNKTTLLHQFGTPKIIKKWPEPFFKGVQKWFQKQAHIQGAKKWYFAIIYYTWARSDVSEMDPILGAVWRPVLHKIQKIRNRRIRKNR